MRYEGRNIGERCFHKLKQWRGIAMRPAKLVRSSRAAISLAAALMEARYPPLRYSMRC